jgi:hypothetical protein
MCFGPTLSGSAVTAYDSRYDVCMYKTASCRVTWALTMIHVVLLLSPYLYLPREKRAKRMITLDSH